MDLDKFVGAFIGQAFNGQRLHAMSRSISCALLFGLWASCSTPAHAFGIGCAEVKDPDAIQALAAADKIFQARWAQISVGAQQGWGAAFKFKTPPRNPFALKTDGPDPADMPPIAGLIAAKSISCLIYEIQSPRAYIVRYTGTGLRFNENAAGWTPPLKPITIMLLNAERRDAAWIAADVPDGRTAIPPFSVLKRPLENEFAEFAGGLVDDRPRPTAKRR
jgi:hypothetical protein